MHQSLNQTSPNGCKGTSNTTSQQGQHLRNNDPNWCGAPCTGDQSTLKTNKTTDCQLFHCLVASQSVQHRWLWHTVHSVPMAQSQTGARSSLGAKYLIWMQQYTFGKMYMLTTTKTTVILTFTQQGICISLLKEPNLSSVSHVMIIPPVYVYKWVVLNCPRPSKAQLFHIIFKPTPTFLRLITLRPRFGEQHLLRKLVEIAR